MVDGTGKVMGLISRGQTWAAVSSQSGDATEGPSQHKGPKLERSRSGWQQRKRHHWQSCLSPRFMKEEI